MRKLNWFKIADMLVKMYFLSNLRCIFFTKNANFSYYVSIYVGGRVLKSSISQSNGFSHPILLFQFHTNMHFLLLKKKIVSISQQIWWLSQFEARKITYIQTHVYLHFCEKFQFHVKCVSLGSKNGILRYHSTIS